MREGGREGGDRDRYGEVSGGRDKGRKDRERERWKVGSTEGERGEG